MATETIALTEAVYYILLSLHTPLHGYGIMQHTQTLSSGRVQLAAGTLYGALNAMLEKGWIQALPDEQESRKKEYVITQNGRMVAQAELLRLRALVANGEQVIGGVGGQSEKDYIAFLEGTGAQHIGKIMSWIYFRKAVTDGPFALFSDLESKIAHLGRILGLMVPVMIIELGAGLLNVTRGRAFNFGVGCVCLCLGALFAVSVLRILRIRSQLRRERLLHE